MLGLQDFGLSIRLVEASDLAPNSCGMSTSDVASLIGEIDVLALPGCLESSTSPSTT